MLLTFGLLVLGVFIYGHIISSMPTALLTSRSLPVTVSYQNNWGESTQPNVTNVSPSPTTTTSPNTTSPNTTTSSESISDTTNNWSGYAATGGTFSGVSGTWTVPQASSSGETAADASWIGIGGIASDDLIQTGTQNVVSADGQVTSSAFYELLPDASEPIDAITVNPGDSITASISETASGQWSINIKDNTNGETYNTSVSYDSSQSSAEWIEEDPSDGVSEMPLDNFGTVAFSNSSAVENGNTVNLSSSNAQALTMVNDEDQTLASTSGITGSGSGFTVTRGSASTDGSSGEFDGTAGSWRRHGSGIGRELGSAE